MITPIDGGLMGVINIFLKIYPVIIYLTYTNENLIKV
jgi:hypothetical protein